MFFLDVNKSESDNIEEYSVGKFYDARIFSFYRDGRFKKAVKMAGLKGNESILDFGCFRQRLRKFLPKGIKYFGYDKNEKYSNVTDWNNLKGIDTVFALAVFEHFPEKELDETIRQFKKNGVKKIVAEFPWEDSPFNRFAVWLSGVGFAHFLTHVSKWRTIACVLNHHYECVAYRSLYKLTWISVWKLRK